MVWDWKIPLYNLLTLLRPLHPTRAYATINSPPTSPILGHPLYLSPAVPHFFYICYEVACPEDSM